MNKWNADIQQFLTTATGAAAATSPPPAVLEECIREFVQKQETVEDDQDLVLARVPRQRGWWTQNTQDAIVEHWRTHMDNPEIVVRQIYVTFWPAMLWLGMICVVIQFLVFYRGHGNGLGGIQWTESSMEKHSAMLLACTYSALAWTLSNGLVLNPMKNIL
jgi:hypothetical protein